MNSIQAKKNIMIVDYLKSKNIFSVKSRKNETVLIYKSPCRDEKNASFEVNTIKNIWFDHGAGEGGTIIDLVICMEKTNISGALEILSGLNTKSFYPYQQKGKIVNRVPAIEIISIKHLTSQYLIDYCISRKIARTIATKYLKEIVYNIGNRKYQVLGFKNDVGGYEFRNRSFKGTYKKKYYTTIKGIFSDQLNIYEGFFDFLSSLIISKGEKPQYDSLILNSVALKQKSKSLVLKYSRLNLFLDNDTAGNEAVKYFKEIHNDVKDYSKKLYPYHNDLNDYLKMNTTLANS